MRPFPAHRSGSAGPFSGPEVRIVSAAARVAAALAERAEEVCRRYLPYGRRRGRVLGCGRPRRRARPIPLRPPRASGRTGEVHRCGHGPSMAICSTSSATASTRRRFARRSTRPAPSSPGRLRRLRARATPTTPPRRHGACGDDAAPSTAAMRKPTCTPGGLARCRFPALRFHPALLYRDGGGVRRLPALVAAVTGSDEAVCGVLRTWLHRPGPPRRM